MVFGNFQGGNGNLPRQSNSLRAEKKAIKVEGPRHNIVHKTATPQPRKNTSSFQKALRDIACQEHEVERLTAALEKSESDLTHLQLTGKMPPWRSSDITFFDELPKSDQDERVAEVTDRYQHLSVLELYDVILALMEKRRIAGSKRHAAFLASLKARKIRQNHFDMIKDLAAIKACSQTYGHLKIPNTRLSEVIMSFAKDEKLIDAYDAHLQDIQTYQELATKQLKEASYNGKSLPRKVAVILKAAFLYEFHLRFSSELKRLKVLADVR